MGKNDHTTFHINLEISSKFVRTSRAVFNDVFLVKEVACANIETTLSLKSPRTLNLQLCSFVAASTETNVTCSGQCDTHTVSGVEYKLTKYVANNRRSFFEIQTFRHTPSEH